MHESPPVAHHLHLGWVVFAILMVLNVLEYWLAVAYTGIMAPLTILAVIDAALIAWYFMHVAQLWRTEEDEHD